MQTNDALVEQLAADLPSDALSKGRAVVLGLDGVPHSMLKELMANGTMPNMARLVAAGTLRRMQSTLPSVSSVAWTSFRTGLNPGLHGITGFTDRRPRTYKTYFPTMGHVLVSTIEEFAENMGMKAFVMGMPVNNPPVRLKNGVSIGCFLCPSVEKAVSPPELSDELKHMGYKLDVNAGLATSDPQRFVEEIFEVTEGYRAAMFHFWEREEWDLIMAHFMSTDRLHHFMWDQYGDPSAPFHGEFLRLYRRLDEIIGEVAARLDEKTLLLMLSDHGFCGIRWEVNLNLWLQQEGFLRFHTAAPKSLEDIDGRSQAYSLIPGRIYLNVKGREPRGSVEPGAEFEEVRARIAERLLELRDPHNGERVIERVETREALYGDEASDVAPDLVAQPRHGYELKDRVSDRELFKTSRLKGMHTYDDAFLFVNRKLDLPEQIKIYEATRIVSEYCRCRSPQR
jgi:predicted AlkP superfamily phosphohydrolase/phosphomutase